VADYREPRRRQLDPLVAVAAEAAAAAVRSADYVTESIRRGTGRRSVGAAAARQRAARARAARSGRYGQTTSTGSEGRAAGSVSGSTADLFVELLERFGEAIQDVAATIAEREWFEGEPECPTLELLGPPGHTVQTKFNLTNTGRSPLARVTFEATDLLGATTGIGSVRIDFRRPDDAQIDRIGPGATAKMIVAVAIPEDVPAGTYRGVIAARSAAPAGRGEEEGGLEDAWALIELEVTAIDRRSGITPAERASEE
jgi:hypothetical protein